MITQTKRYYPALPEGTHPDLAQTIKDLHDHVYDLRDELRAVQTKKAEETQPRKAFTQEIQGIQVKAVTDPSSLQNGYTIRFNSATGQFEFGA
jgi:hypothetical protein